MAVWDDILRLQREFDRLQPDLRPALEQMSRVSSDVTRLHQAIENHQKELERVFDAFRGFSIGESLSHVVAEFERTQTRVADLLAPHAVFESTLLTDFSRVSKAFAALVSPFDVESMTVMFADRQSAIQREQNISESSARQVLVTEVRESVAAMPISATTIQFIVATLLSLFLFLLQEQSSRRSTGQVLDTLRAVQEQLQEVAASLESGAPAQSEEVGATYIVSRPVTVMSRRNGGRATGILHPGHRVALLERGGRWVLVEYFDLGTKALRQGWVPKKYLQRSKR